MSSMTHFFTREEAQRLMDRRVKLIQRIEGRFEGETGIVYDAVEYRAGWALVVRWDIGYGDGVPRDDHFCRDEFDTYVREV